MTTHVRLLALLAAAAVVGCSGSPEPAFQVALVTPGPVSDAGWNAAAFSGLQRIAGETGAATAHMEAAGPAEFEEAFRDFARRGFRLVFGHGFEMQDAAVSVAADFSGTDFVVTSGLAVRPNVAGLVFHLEDAAYLAGVLAGSMTESGVLGAVGGMEIPPVRLVFDGFERGVRSVRPDARVKEVFLGSWEDVAGARQAALALVEQGADLVVHNADAAGLGVFQAARERGVWALGTNSDQAAVAPDVVLASAAMDIPAAMVQVARDVEGGRFEGHVYVFDLHSGVVELAFNPALAGAVPDGARAAVAEARRRLEAGEVTLEHFDR